MNGTPARLEKPLLLTSSIGFCISLYAALGGNFLLAASIFGVTFVLLGQMLDYAIAAQNGQPHWLAGRGPTMHATFSRAGGMRRHG